MMALTGFPVCVWYLIGRQYLPRYPRTDNETDEQLWAYMMAFGAWMKHYPHDDQLSQIIQFTLPGKKVLSVNDGWCVCSATACLHVRDVIVCCVQIDKNMLKNHVWPLAMWLSWTVDECKFERRKSLMNHVPHFPLSTTMMADSTPFKTQMASDTSIRWSHLNGKDCADALQVLLLFLSIGNMCKLPLTLCFAQIHFCSTFDLQIVSKMGGAHDPKTSDADVFNKFVAPLLEDWERILGDQVGCQTD